MTRSRSSTPSRPPRTHLRTFEAYQVPSEELLGWCIQYRVWAYGYAGQPIPEAILREDLDCAVQHHRIHGRLWDQTGGLGTRYGAPGRPLPLSPADRKARALDEREEWESRQRTYANDLDDDYIQERWS